jgi:hypothetical protein
MDGPMKCWFRGFFRSNHGARARLGRYLCQLGPTKSYIDGCEVQQRTTRTRGLTTRCNEMM